MQSYFNICKSVNVKHHINKRIKPSKHLNRCGETFDKAQIQNKVFNESATEEIVLNLILASIKNL